MNYTKINEKNYVLDFSSSSVFIKQCPRKTIFDFVNKEKLRGFQNKNKLGVIGIVKHEIFKLYQQQCIKEKTPKLEINKREKLFSDYFINDCEYIFEEKELEDILKTMNYFLDFYNVNYDKIIMLEDKIYLDKNFKLTTSDDENALVKGVIDTAEIYDEETLEIIDLKTGYKQENDTFQLLIYALLASAVFPQFTKFRFKLIYSTYNFIEDFNKLVLTKENLNNAKSMIYYYYVKINNNLKKFYNKENIVAYDNYACDYCVYKNYCFKDLIGKEPKPNELNWVLFETMYKEEKEKIKEFFTEDKLEIFINKRKFIKKESEKWSVENNDLITNFLKENSFNNLISNVYSKTSLQKILNKIKNDEVKTEYIKSLIIIKKYWDIEPEEKIHSIDEFEKELLELNNKLSETELKEFFSLLKNHKPSEIQE
jgi:hypothetical protein